jgi:hypothetical protein
MLLVTATAAFVETQSLHWSQLYLSRNEDDGYTEYFIKPAARS